VASDVNDELLALIDGTQVEWEGAPPGCAGIAHRRGRSTIIVSSQCLKQAIEKFILGVCQRTVNGPIELCVNIVESRVKAVEN
jgi:hypothetical protein